MKLIIYDQVSSKIFDLRDQKVILDSDVMELYDVETKRINEAAKRNPDELDLGEWVTLKSQFSTSKNVEKRSGKIKYLVVFTERGLYMLAIILKSQQAVDTTIAIINTFFCKENYYEK